MIHRRLLLSLASTIALIGSLTADGGGRWR